MTTKPDQRWRVALRGTSTADDQVVNGIEFSSTLSLSEADALLCFFGLTEEILTYSGPKAWYQEEPITMSHFRTPLARKARRVLGPEGFFHHTNPNPEWRVLSPTHCARLDTVSNVQREHAAVALVSNYGGRYWWAFRGNRLRNHFILHDSVRLFGSKAGWEKFRLWPWSRAGVPCSYCGEVNARWWDDSQVQFLAGYKVAVCMENSLDSPNYFTEKFVNAARAGCIPVFHARPEVRKERLAGARWVDPADFNFDPASTIDHALKQNIEDFQKANQNWLRCESLAATHRSKIWERIAVLMRRKIETSGDK